MALVIPLKKPIKYDLKGPLTSWLDEPSDGNGHSESIYPKPKYRSYECMKELKRLASVRNCLSESILKSDAHKHAIDDFALKDCHEYHAALVAFEEKGFPTWDEFSPLKLTWCSSVSPAKEQHGSLVWDRVCTLWNIAALESFQASQQSKDKEGRKAAVKHYQNASASMKYLRESLKGQQFDTVDMNKSLIQFWEMAMLAQAQIAAYDMASESGKHSLLSYLAMGAVPVLNDALTHAKDPFVLSNLPKPIEEWAGECKAQSMLLTARAEFHQAIMHRQLSEWGKELARLSRAEIYLKECINFHKNTSRDLTKAETILRLVHDRKVKLKKENDTMYNDRVPDDLDEIPAKLLVKNDLPMPESLRTTTVPIFV